MTKTTKGYTFALLTAICWSLSGVLTKSIHQSSYIIAGFEGLFGLVYIYYKFHKNFTYSPFIWIVGFCQFMMHITFIIANKYATVGNVIVLQYCSMIFILFYQMIDTRKKPYPYQILVIILALIGMIVFFFDSFSFEGVIGNVLAIVSGAFFGLQFYLNTKKQANPDSSMFLQECFCFTSMLVYICITKDFHLNIHDLTLLSTAGITQGAMAGVFFALCITCIPAFTANVICMSEIVFAPLWAFIFLHEMFTPISFIGACIIISSLIFNTYMDHKMEV